MSSSCAKCILCRIRHVFCFCYFVQLWFNQVISSVKQNVQTQTSSNLVNWYLRSNEQVEMHVQTVRRRNSNAELRNVWRHQSSAIEACQDWLCQIIRRTRQEACGSWWSQSEITKNVDEFYDGEHKLLPYAILFIFRLIRTTTCTTR